MTHTEEPWEWWSANLTFVGWRPDCGENWERSALCNLSGYKQEAEANARRIVACVNACAGIPTEELESVSSCSSQWGRLDELGEVAFFYANKGDTE